MPPGGVRLIAAGFEPTDEGRAALRVAAALARATGAKLLATMVLDPKHAEDQAPGLLARTTHDQSLSENRHTRDRLTSQDALDAAIAELATGVDTEPDVLYQEPLEGLEAVSHRADLLVVGPRCVRADAQRHARRRLAQADRLRGMPGPRAAARHGGAHPDGRCRPLRARRLRRLTVEATGWSGLFAVAFRQSRNPMTLVDEARRHVDVNGAYLRLTGYKREDLIGRPIWEFVAGGPLLSQEQWAAALATRRFTGEAAMVCHDGREITIQWGAGTEIITGQRLVLFVALGSGARRSRRFTADGEDREPRPLSKRETEVVALRGARLHRARDRRRAAHLARHRAHARAQRDGEDGARSRAHLVAKVLGNGIALG